MLKIRLMRIGGRQRPFYRVVAVDERQKRTGAYIELLGTYNPLTEPKDIKLKQDRIDHWIKQGAQMSDGFLRIIGKAPQRPPRKPKKEKKELSDTNKASEQKTEDKKEEKVEETTPEQQAPEQPAEAPATEEVKTEEKPAEETTVGTPAETPVAEKAPIEETPTETSETVIASEAKQSSPEENPEKIATEPTAPRNDEVKESEKKDEGSA